MVLEACVRLTAGIFNTNLTAAGWLQVRQSRLRVSHE